ncbi:MAG: hypothetical protein HY094_07990 [Candidatus Melainabacteria bacterium]|nr:hypothetical protein [Candidatus Melainabacteria bacterium]
MAKVRFKKPNTFKKNNKETLLQALIKKFTNINSLYLLGTMLLVLIIYSFSLFRPWQPFDEKIIYAETLLPIPTRLDEIFEDIHTFVVNCHTESMNSTFSNHMTIRSVPLAWSIFVFISYFFKTSPFLYHSFLLVIHLINTVLVWFILKKISQVFKYLHNNEQNHLVYTVISLFTLLWALHSANTEAVLLATNWNGILTFTFCFAFLLYEISRILENNFKNSKLRIFIISCLFLLQMSFAEHGYSFPLIILFVIFAFMLRQSNKFKYSLLTSLKLSSPYFIGLILFLLTSFLQADSPMASLFSNKETLDNHIKESSFYIFLERNLWLTPQIFFHFIKLLVFPKTLSAYQSNHVHLANSIFEPYSIFCTLFYLIFILLPLTLFILVKNQNVKFICILFYAFLFSLIPYLQIITPTYCLIADRYCYFPSFLLLFLIYISLCTFSNWKRPSAVISILLCLLFLMTVRTLVRIQDWSNAYTFYDSAIKIEKDPLYKGKKLTVLGDVFGSQKMMGKMEEYYQEAIKELQKAIKQLRILRKRNPVQPVTLKLYGLDYDTQLLKAAFGIAIIRSDNYQVPPKDILAFFEKYIKNDLDLLSCNQLLYYAKLLLSDGQIEKAKSVLEYGFKKFPYYMDLMHALADFYLDYEKNQEKAFELLQYSYKYFPNKGITLYKLLRYYEIKNDLINQAKFSYLLGLRDHYAKGYQKAAQIYLDLNNLPEAHKTLKKLVRLNANDPLSLLLMSRYLDVSGKRSKILEILNAAYLADKALGTNKDIRVTKGILTSLINVNTHLKDFSSVRKYLNELEGIKDLTQIEKKQILNIKQQLLQAGI